MAKPVHQSVTHHLRRTRHVLLQIPFFLRAARGPLTGKALAWTNQGTGVKSPEPLKTNPPKEPQAIDGWTGDNFFLPPTPESELPDVELTQ